MILSLESVMPRFLVLLACIPVAFTSGWTAWGKSVRSNSLPETIPHTDKGADASCSIPSHDDTDDDTWITAGRSTNPPSRPRSNSLPQTAQQYQRSKNLYPSDVLPSACQKYIELLEYGSCLNHGSPSWVVEYLEINMMGTPRDRSLYDFKPHTLADRAAESMIEAYKKTPFDRGHLAPASHHSKNSQAYIETFWLPTNVLPQYRTMNQVDWTRLEDFIFHLLTQSTVSGAYVVTGAIYDSDFKFSYKRSIEHFPIPKARAIGDKVKIDVPSHMYKIVQFSHATNGKKSTSAFVMPNQLIKQEYPIEAYEVPVSEIDRATTFTDFSAMKSSATLCSIKKSLCGREFSTDDRVVQRFVDWMTDRSPRKWEDLASFVKHAIIDKLVLHSQKNLSEKLVPKYKSTLSTLKNHLGQNASFDHRGPAVFYCEQLKNYEADLEENLCQIFLADVFVNN